jgi:hypothetical protein
LTGQARVERDGAVRRVGHRHRFSQGRHSIRGVNGVESAGHDRLCRGRLLGLQDQLTAVVLTVTIGSEIIANLYDPVTARALADERAQRRRGCRFPREVRRSRIVVEAVRERAERRIVEQHIVAGCHFPLANDVHFRSGRRSQDHSNVFPIGVRGVEREVDVADHEVVGNVDRALERVVAGTAARRRRIDRQGRHRQVRVGDPGLRPVGETQVPDGDVVAARVFIEADARDRLVGDDADEATRGPGIRGKDDARIRPPTALGEQAARSVDVDLFAGLEIVVDEVEAHSVDVGGRVERELKVVVGVAVVASRGVHVTD